MPVLLLPCGLVKQHELGEQVGLAETVSQLAPSSSTSLLLRMRFHKCSSCVSPHNKQHFQKSPSSKLLGPPNSFTAELSRPASTTQQRIRATILGTLRSPGADSHHERQPASRYRDELRYMCVMCRESYFLSHSRSLRNQ